MNKLKTALKSTTILFAGLLLIFFAGYKSSADSSFSGGKYYYSQLDDELAQELYKMYYTKLISNGKCKELASNPDMIFDGSLREMTVSGSAHLEGDELIPDAATQAKITALKNRIKNAVYNSFYAFSNDYAVVFWPAGVSYSVGYSWSYYTLSNVTWKITLTKVTFSETYSGEVDTDKIQAFNNGVDTAFNQIKSKLPSGASDYDKVKAIHDYLCTRLVYANTQRAHTAEGAFYDDNKAVCEGYAEAFQILAERFGLTSVMVSGDAINSSGSPEGHKWNMVKMEDGKWYLVDVTWDDQTSGIHYTYMLSGKDTMGFHKKQSEERAEDDLLKYPSWNSTAYLYTPHTHSLELVPAKTPTCEEDGYEAYYMCSGCGRMFSDANGNYPITAPVIIPELGHDLVWHDAVPADCDTDGREGYYECTRCHKLFSDAEGKNEITAPAVIPALGHALELREGKAATCTEDGWQPYYECTRCHKLYSDDEGKNEITAPVVINKLGHDLVTHNAKSATCDEDGYETYYECSRCHKLYSDSEGLNEITAPVVIPKTSHDLVSHDAKAATCTENGYKAYYECDRCHKIFSDADGKKEISAPAVITKLGHALKAYAAKAPTKTEPGNIAYYECQRCYRFFSDKDCKHEITKADIVIPATGHDLTKVAAKAATCTEDGNIEYYICKDTDCGCGKVYSDAYGQNEISKASTVIHATGHDIVPVAAKEPTCDTDGYESHFKCRKCGKLFSDSNGTNEITAAAVKPKLGHAWDEGEVTTEPGCETEGVKTFRCTREGCQKTKTEKIDPLGHDPEHYDAKEPTAKEGGWKEHYRCKRCGKRFADEACTKYLQDSEVLLPKLGSPLLNEEYEAGSFNYRVTNPADNGTGAVSFIGVKNPTEAVVIPGSVVIKGITYKVNRIASTAFFNDTTVKTVYIGANVLIIDTNAFFGCSNLVKVSGGARVKTIGTNAFARCPKLSTFVITSTALYKISPQAFYKDSRLKTIYIKNTAKLTKGGVKKSLKGSSVKTVKVKKSKVSKYKKYFKKSNSGRTVKVKK